MKLRYVGPNFGAASLTNNKVYTCLGIKEGFIRIIDDSDEDYLYSVIPGPLWDESITGRWELVEDDDQGTLQEVLAAAEKYLSEKESGQASKGM